MDTVDIDDSLYNVLILDYINHCVDFTSKQHGSEFDSDSALAQHDSTLPPVWSDRDDHADSDALLEGFTIQCVLLPMYPVTALTSHPELTWNCMISSAQLVFNQFYFINLK